jgi:hypothetical protein
MKTVRNIPDVKRRRRSNRKAGYDRPQCRVGTSLGQPVHIGFYLDSMLDENGRADREHIVELFNTERYG